jgi:diaminopimelate decarboxylase
MQTLCSYMTQQAGFFGQTDPVALAHKYGTPLYVYSEPILRMRCRELKGLLSYPQFKVHYSAKANSNLRLLGIIRQEGLDIDAVSAGEIHLALAAGFRPEQILFVANNVSTEEMAFAVDRGVLVSVDSISQLCRFGKLCPGGKVVVRFNTGVGAGHHAKVVTGGKDTKFGVDPALIGSCRDALSDYRLQLVGIHQHIGSLFMQPEPYVEGMKALLLIAEQFAGLDFIDLGGGFGVPYHKADGEPRLDLANLGRAMGEVMGEWSARKGRQLALKVESGRYAVAECGVLLAAVQAVKHNYGKKYVGTDAGFNVLIRPALYDSYHEIEVYRAGSEPSGGVEQMTVVGNVCETGDVIARDRLLPQILEGDVLGVLDAGAYGWAMSSNYNSRLRPAEVLIRMDGGDELIRRRETLDDLLRGCQRDCV